MRSQERINCLRRKPVLAGPNWIAGVESSVASLDIGSGRPISPGPVSPLQPLTEAQKTSLRTIDPLDIRRKLTCRPPCQSAYDRHPQSR